MRIFRSWAPARPWWPQPHALRWLPWGGGLLWLAWEAAWGRLRPDLPHLLGAGLIGAAWLLGRRQWSAALLVAALLLPTVWHLGLGLPAARALLVQRPEAVRLEGTVRARWTPPETAGYVGLLLGNAVLWAGDAPRDLAEVEVLLPAPSEWAFGHRARLRIAGRLTSRAPWGATGQVRGTGQVTGPVTGPVTGQGRLRLHFAQAESVRLAPPIRPWDGEALRLHLRDRAAYYLSPSALGTYLPVVLGLRERTTPEARAVAAAFRRVGVAHLFAISGLHVGLLYLVCGALLHWLSGGLQPARGWAHGPGLRRAAVMAAIWVYVALIGFPLPAVRAALMGSALIWNEQWGTRAPPLYVLALAGLVLLAFDASQLYDVSFQLSFLAYFFLLCALGVYAPPAAEGHGPWWLRLLRGAWAAARLNLWMTLVITAGLWPLVTVTFGRLPLLVFLGNLVMVPLLGFVILPLGLAGLAVSLAHTGAAPGAWAERATFALLDAALRGWVWIVERLDAIAAPLVLAFRPQHDARVFLLYYAFLLAGLAWAYRRKIRRQSHPRTQR